jgi:DNA-binding CsgD family transcriptional regulator
LQLVGHVGRPENRPVVTSLVDHRRSLVRVLGRDLDLVGYFDALDRALQRHVPFDASCWLSLDPGTALPTSHFSREYGIPQLMGLVANEFLEDDVNKFATLMRQDRPVATLRQATDAVLSRSRRYLEFLTPLGYGDGDEVRAVFREDGVVWGAAALHRRSGAFSEREIDLLTDVGELIAFGIRRTILRTALARGHDPEAPGLILLRGDDTVESVTPAAERWLAELFEEPSAAGTPPLTVVSIATRARRAAATTDAVPVSVRLPRRSGGWLRMDGSCLDGDPPGRVAVIISPAREPEVASLIVEIYGLSSREREVTRLVLHGYSTQDMAAALNVSPYTVQDHLKSIFRKVGVRSRRELVSQLFLQQVAPRLSAGMQLGSDGWFSSHGPEASVNLR